MNEKDRRVRRTKKLLKSSLVELLCEKSIRNITVRELTDRADISRGAFYTHYNDVNDLYDQMENELFEEMSSLMAIDPAHSYVEVYKSLIDYVHDNASVCRIFIGKDSESTFRDKLVDVFEEKTMQTILYEKNAKKAKTDWEYLTRFI